MSARLTVVLDDEELYRRLKVKAAQDGVPMKDLIERGLRSVLEGAAPPAGPAKAFDWDAYEAMLARLEEQDAAQLYGYPERTRRWTAAEEPAQYDAP